MSSQPINKQIIVVWAECQTIPMLITLQYLVLTATTVPLTIIRVIVQEGTMGTDKESSTITLPFLIKLHNKQVTTTIIIATLQCQHHTQTPTMECRTAMRISLSIEVD